MGGVIKSLVLIIPYFIREAKDTLSDNSIIIKLTFSNIYKGEYPFLFPLIDKIKIR